MVDNFLGKSKKSLANLIKLMEFSGNKGVHGTLPCIPENEMEPMGSSGELTNMDFSVCSQCSIEIEGKGIHYRDRVFCCDECCEEFEAAYVAIDEPEIDELEDEIDSELEEVDLGYEDDEEKPKDKFFDDDYDINPEDF